MPHRRLLTTKTVSLVVLPAIALVCILGLVRGQGVAALGDSAQAAAVEGISSTGVYSLPLYMPAVFSAVPNPIGVQFYGVLDPARGVDLMDAANAGWIRVTVDWSRIEPVDVEPADYNWSSIDRTVSVAHEAGIRLVLTIVWQPGWFSEHPNGEAYPGALPDMDEFVGALVERFDGDGIDDAPGSPVVRYFELYNEPDNTSGQSGAGFWGHRGAEYAELMKRLYPVVKAASPSAKWVVGGLAHDWFEEDGGVFDRDFLDDFLAACRGSSCYDVMNFHYYPIFREEWEPYGPDIIGKTRYFQQKLDLYGQGDKELICTETGWWGLPDWGGDEGQSRYVVKVYTRGMAAGLPIVIWFKADDIEYPTNTPGLLDLDRQPKAAYTAFQATVSQLQGATFVRALTPQETGSSQIEGYIFHNRYGRRLDVVWTEDVAHTIDPYDDPNMIYTAYTSELRVTDKYAGTMMTVRDSDDGKMEGRIEVMVGGSPLFVEYVPPTY